MKKIGIVLFLAIYLSYYQAYTQEFYDLNIIQKIELQFAESNWDYKLDTAKLGNGSYIQASWVKINGVAFNSVGVKYKGNSSYDSSRVKNPVHIELNTYIPGQSYQGYQDIKLNNGWFEPSFVRDVLANQIARKYMPAIRANYAQLYINGTYLGLYANVESINNDFVRKHFHGSENPFFKCNPIVYQAQNFPTLEYLGSDSILYQNNYEIKSTAGWQELIQLIDTLNNNPSDINKVLNVDRALWMLAFNNVIVNLDSYTGIGSQNYYLYQDNYQRFNTIPWDLNMSFGSFNIISPGPTGALSLSQLQQLSPTLQAANTTKPLINKLLGIDRYKKMYIAHMKTIVNENFANQSYLDEIDYLRTIIDTAVQSDPNKFFTYTQFQNSITQGTSFASTSIPGIQVLMESRTAFLNSSSEFQQVAPLIEEIVPSDTVKNPGELLNIQVFVSLADSVFWGYRYFPEEVFTRIPMYDDGLHHDGQAQDGIFGIEIEFGASQLQYYIYAENQNAGIFSPERAEYEFYTIDVNPGNLLPGSVSINEFMAINNSYETNEFGEFEDWIELKNLTNEEVNLSGAYVSDNRNITTKFTLPAGTILPPHAYLVIFCDEETSSSSYLHAPFKLSGEGDDLTLLNLNGEMIDSVQFGTQYGDVSMGRCPDGTGSFSFMYQPSFLSANCEIGITEEQSNNLITYPNPGEGLLTIQVYEPGNTMVELFNSAGQLVRKQFSNESLIQLDFTNQPSGIFLCKVTTNQRHTKSVKIIKN